MRIAHNISAQNAFNLLKDANDTLQGTIQSLSTGMRINSASDDASGLAISEKMRAQVSGLDIASKNAQDGISLLQTAEGALDGITSMLQRMRELSVQSANDVLTQEDRTYLQAEIDQLKQEIDRTARTTQFNKKNILNGEASFVWSSSDLGLSAMTNGSAGGLSKVFGQDSAEGNYDLEISVKEQGTAQVQKSQIINVKEIETNYVDYEILINEGTDIIGATSGNGWKFSGNRLEISKDGTYCVSGTLDASGKPITTNNYIQIGANVKAKVILRDVSITATQYAFCVDDGAEVDIWLDPGEHNNPNTFKANEGGSHTAAIQAPAGSTLTISSMSGDYSTDGKLIAIGSTHGAGIGSSCATGSTSTTADAGNIIIYGGTIEATGGEYGAGIGGGSMDGATPGQSGNITIHGGHITATGGMCGAGIGSGSGSALPDTGTITITGGVINATGGAGFGYGQGAGIGGGGNVSGTTINISSNASVTVSGFTDANQQESIGYGEHGTGGATINYTNAMPPEPREVPERPDPVKTFKFREYALSEIEQFYDDDGQFLFEDPQKLTVIQGNGKSATVTLYASDTMYDVADKINKAIADGLGQGKYADNAKFCTIADGTRDSEAAYSLDFDEGNIKSTMLVRSVIPGKEGELHFSGSEKLLNALGLNTLQEASETVYSTTIRDAHTGKLLSEGLKSTGNIIRNAIGEDVDIKFDSMAATEAVWNAQDNKYNLENFTYSATLHLKGNSMKLQTGANEGERFEVKIGDMSASALGIEDIDITSRENAARATTIIDNAIDKVLTQRASLGASQNTLEHTVTRLAAASENMTQSESKIRDADMAKVMMALTKFQIKTQAGISMLGQANQMPQQVLSLMR